MQEPLDSLPETVASETLGRFALAINKLGSVFSLLFLISMSVLLIEVVMRYAFHRPTIWAHETTTFLCAISFVFGGLYSVSKNSHIRIVLLYDTVGPKVKRYLDIMIYTICGVATAIFSYATWPTVYKSMFNPAGEFHLITSGSAWNPPFPAILRIFLFIVLVAMTVQFALFVIYHVRRKVS